MAYQKSKNKSQPKKLMTVVKQSIPMLSLFLTTACMVEAEVTQPLDQSISNLTDSNPFNPAYDASLDQSLDMLKENTSSYDGNTFSPAYDASLDQYSHPLDMSDVVDRVDQGMDDQK